MGQNRNMERFRKWPTNYSYNDDAFGIFFFLLRFCHLCICYLFLYSELADWKMTVQERKKKIQTIQTFILLKWVNKMWFRKAIELNWAIKISSPRILDSEICIVSQPYNTTLCTYDCTSLLRTTQILGIFLTLLIQSPRSLIEP